MDPFLGVPRHTEDPAGDIGKILQSDYFQASFTCVPNTDNEDDTVTGSGSHNAHISDVRVAGSGSAGSASGADPEPSGKHSFVIPTSNGRALTLPKLPERRKPPQVKVYCMPGTLTGDARRDLANLNLDEMPFCFLEWYNRECAALHTTTGATVEQEETE